MKNDLISIIVPIYNVEQYIDKCVESIINQSYTNLEIILVDDGSPDNCPKKCDNWSKKDKRIRVIHKKNGGLSDARNTGILNCKGKYISFIDSDDWIPYYSIELLYNNLINNNADISSGFLMDVYNRDIVDDNKFNDSYSLNSIDALEKLMYLHDISNSASGKIYKKELFSDILFPVGKHYEDLGTIYKVYAKSNKVAVTNSIVYYYYQNLNSIMHLKYTSKRLEALDFALDELDFIEEKYPSIKDAAIYRLFYECIRIIHDMPYNSSDKKIVKKYIRKYRSNVLKDKHISRKQKLLCFSSYFGQFGIKSIFKFKKILSRGD